MLKNQVNVKINYIPMNKSYIIIRYDNYCNAKFIDVYIKDLYNRLKQHYEKNASYTCQMGVNCIGYFIGTSKIFISYCNVFEQ